MVPLGPYQLNKVEKEKDVVELNRIEEALVVDPGLDLKGPGRIYSYGEKEDNSIEDEEVRRKKGEVEAENKVDKIEKLEKEKDTDINDEVLVEDPDMDPQGLNQVYMIGDEYDEDLGGRKIFCTDCAFAPCLCDLTKLEIKLTALKKAKEEEKEVVKEEGKEEGSPIKPDVEKRFEEGKEDREEMVQEKMVEGGAQKEGREVEIITTTTPTPQSTIAPNKEEKKKEEPTLIEKMRMMGKKKEEEIKLTGTKEKKTPGRKKNSKKKEEEKEKKEVPMKNMMMNWVKKKEVLEEEKSKEQRGVKALMDKFNKKIDNTNTYDEWKRKKEEKGGKKRKVEEVDRIEGKDSVMEGQGRNKLPKINIPAMGKLNFKSKNNLSCSSNNGEGELQEERGVVDGVGGQGVDDGVIGTMVQRAGVRDLTRSQDNIGAAAAGRKPVLGKVYKCTV